MQTEGGEHEDSNQRVHSERIGGKSGNRVTHGDYHEYSNKKFSDAEINEAGKRTKYLSQSTVLPGHLVIVIVIFIVIIIVMLLFFQATSKC